MTDTAKPTTAAKPAKPSAETAEGSEYKSTLLLPRTEYPMKAGLDRLEPALQERWRLQDIYARIRAARAGAPKFVLHDGPPYATGDLHIGTGLNKVLKDIVVRFHTMTGKDCPYRPGWDCHGLPIESKVMKELGHRARATPTPELRRLCHDYAMKFFARNREDFCRLGIFGEWGTPYLTVDPVYEAGILDVFADMVERGYVYRALRPIHWCIEDETALAEAELEYARQTSPSITVRFPLVDDVSDLFPALRAESHRPMPGASVDLLIWTTTPWTLAANVAIAANADVEYALVRYTDPNGGPTRYVVLAAALVSANMAKAGITDYAEIGRVWGRQLEHRRYRHVFLDRMSPVVLADYVTIEGEGRKIDESQILEDDDNEQVDSWSGTGLVHTAPGHGREDFITGRKYGLDTLSPVDSGGRYTPGCGLPDLVGKTVFAANPEVVELLRRRGVLFHHEPYRHQYAHCWRCHKPVIFRATEQWFVSVDHKDLRGRMSKQIRQCLRFVPEAGANRIGSMIERRPDWCISRQRHWGVAIPAFFNRHTREGLVRADVVRHVRDLFATHGSGIWFERTVAELLPPNFRDGPNGEWTAADFEKDAAIFDVWFESGASHRSVLRDDPRGLFPADVYLEGSDQHRGWFQVSLITAMAAQDSPPFRQVVTHGFIVDQEGKKMSKSAGNYICLADGIKFGGADLFRLWVASVDFTSQIRTTKELMTRVHDPYRSYRNTLRILLANLSDFDHTRHAVPDAGLTEIDRWLLARLAGVIRDCRQAYEQYQFYRVYARVMQFCSIDVSAFYVDVLKDRMYCDAAGSPARRSSQTVMHRTLSALIRLMAPVLVHTAEEAWGYFRVLGGGASSADLPDSVHLTLLPEAPMTPDAERESAELLARWERLLRIRADVNRELEKLRRAELIGKSTEAMVELHTNDAGLRTELTRLGSDTLAMVLMVSDALVVDAVGEGFVAGSDVPGLSVRAVRGSAPKCMRCWNLRPDVGTVAGHPKLCRRCATVVMAKADNDGR